MVEIDKKTIGISSIISLGLILTMMITPTFFDNPQYYCENEQSIMTCEGGLSGGLETRCYLNTEKTSWDYCKTGWFEITDDRVVQEKEIIIELKTFSSRSGSYDCKIDGCEI